MKRLLLALSAWAFAGSVVAAVPPIPPSAPTISSVYNLGATLRSQGWSVIGSFGMNLGGAALANVSISNQINGSTFAFTEVSPVGVPKIRLLYDNYYTNGVPNNELPNTNDIYIHAGVNAYQGVVTDTTINSEQYGRAYGKQLLITDDIAYPVTANTEFLVRTYCGFTGSTLLCPRNDGPLPTGYVPSTHEGATGEDAVVLGNPYATASANSFQGYGPVAVLGYTGSQPNPSLGCEGDSIPGGTGDGAGERPGANGWCLRAVNDIQTLSEQYSGSITPLYGHMIDAHSGDTLANFITAGQHEAQIRDQSFTSTVMSDLGTNDLGVSVIATMKANKLTEAALWACYMQATCPGQLNVKFVAATLLPRTTSTDGGVTVTNQTKTGNETERVQFNDWLRDTSAAGFVAQAAAATGLSTSAFGVFDASAAVEVNASNVLTQDGGYWIAPTGSAAYSGTITGSPVSNGFTDTAISPSTVNAFRGYTIVFTSGTDAGFNSVVITQAASTGVISAVQFHATPSTGNAYGLWSNVAFFDGTHPASYGHQLIAAAFETWLKANIR